jgi:hypothetical protein
MAYNPEPVLGQAAMAASLPVAIASNQSSIPVSIATAPVLVAGSATIGSVKVTDGTNTATVKPASTAALATDPALVVTLSPNAPIQAVSQSGTWTVQPGNTANTTAWKVDGSAVTQPVSGTVTANAGTGPFPAAGMVASGSANANNPVKIGGAFNTTQPTVTNAQIVDSQHTARGAQIVATGVDTFTATIGAAIPTGANTIGAVTQASGPWTSNITQAGGTNISTGTGAGGAGIPRVTVSNDSNVLATQSGTWTAVLNPATSGGLSTTKLISAASTNATSLKASAGQIYNVQAFNLNAAPRYLKVYNKASAPTVGTDTPVNVWMIPGNTTGAGFVLEISNGVAFATGIAYAITGGITDADTTAIGANEVVVNIQYK